MSPKDTAFKIQKFAGLTLGGGKGRKTSLSILEVYVKENKIFLSELHENIQESDKLSSDSEIIKILDEHSIHTLAIDAPLKLPKCLRCRLICPGHEKCEEPEISWMWKWHKSRSGIKRPNKIFTPYTERCVEQYISTNIEADIYPDHALGSNRAPLTARALYLKRRMKNLKLIEVLPRLSIWQLGINMGIRKTQLPYYKHMTKGSVIRQKFLDQWCDDGLSFIYHRDFKHMVKDAFAFESFICAYTAYLNSRGLCEPRPLGFPKSEAWIAYPKVNL